MKSLVQPDGRVLAPWESHTAWPGQGSSTSPDMAAVLITARPVARAAVSNHPLAEPTLSAGLQRRAEEIVAAFSRIEPVLRELAPRQFEDGFPAVAQRELEGSLAVSIPTADLTATWSTPMDLGALYARCVLSTFQRLVESEFDRSLALLEEGEDAAEVINRFGFHAIAITSCADGRMGGVVDFILRVPPTVVSSHDSYAGAMFDVESALHDWEAVELRRWREGIPNAAEDPTRYLKIGVYHFSSMDPLHEGCAAHDSDDDRAASDLLALLREFEGAVEATHGDASGVATLLVGADTDTDAIRVHVPDASGATSISRYVSSADLYEETANLERAAAKQLIRDRVAECAGVDAEDPTTEGIRWLSGYLLKNNIGQVDAVRTTSGGSYADAGHAEKLVVAGDAIDDVQLRNLTFQAQMSTMEEGSSDLDVGMRILGHSHSSQGLSVPVLVHTRYDGRIPGARGRAAARAGRLTTAIEKRYAAGTPLVVHAVVRAEGSAHLELVDVAGSPVTSSPSEKEETR